MINSSATTAPVTASRLLLAPANELAISAPNAGPPVTFATSPAGRPSRAASRKPVTVSERAKPLRSGFSATGATAALPSVAPMIGGPGAAITPVTPAIRSRACWAASSSSGDRSAPSARLITSSTGAASPPGNALITSAARTDSASGGRTTGDCSAEPLCGIRPSRAPPSAATTSANTHDRRLETISPMRSHSGRRTSGARCMSISSALDGVCRVLDTLAVRGSRPPGRRSAVRSACCRRRPQPRRWGHDR